MEFRSTLLLPAGSNSLYVGQDLACGLPLQTLDTVVNVFIQNLIWKNSVVFGIFLVKLCKLLKMLLMINHNGI